MTRRISFLTLVVCLALGSAVFAYWTDLDRANRMRDNGDYWGARSLYRSIADNYYSDEYSRRQAAYFVGFCSVRLNDSWTAIEDFRRFLRNFDNGNTTLIPDALYVLGRTYEERGDNYRARECYYSCIDRFGYGEFAEKSRERLRYLGGYNGGNGGGYPSPLPPNCSIENGGNPDQKAVSKATSTKMVKKLSGNDPFEGFKMDIKKEKIEEQREKFDKLHENK